MYLFNIWLVNLPGYMSVSQPAKMSLTLYEYWSHLGNVLEGVWSTASYLCALSPSGPGMGLSLSYIILRR